MNISETVSVLCLLRPDLMDNYLALVLSAFIRNGLLEVRLINTIKIVFLFLLAKSFRATDMMHKYVHVYCFATMVFYFYF